jgi:hypothetical protein
MVGVSHSAAIKRAAGLTPSERYLAGLAEQSFLDLWSYPNLYIDRRSNGGTAAGKELCDLLVVCGDHLLIFSDKTVNWPAGDNVDVNWSRWYRRAIEKSAAQVRGAERWLMEHPDRVFLDAACTQTFPLDLPLPAKRRVHGIVVAHGAAAACRKVRGGSGSLEIVPRLVADGHVDPLSADYRPLAVGDIEPSGSFIHVFDEVSLGIVLRELDTISDFADYLDRKAQFVRSGHLEEAAGEEDLLAYYLVHTDADQEHAFVTPDGTDWKPGQRLRIIAGSYNDVRNQPAYVAKKKADRPSYAWDTLISTFTKNVLAGTLVEGPSWAGSAVSKDHELGLRFMALENRTQRRAFGEGLIDAMSRVGTKQRFARGLLPAQHKPERRAGYVVLLLRFPDLIASPPTYDEYRQLRSSMLYGYVLNTLVRHPHLERCIGIATEPPPQFTGRSGSSEDLVYMEQSTWSEEELAEAARFKSHYQIFGDDTLTEYNVHTKEYPDFDPDPDSTYSNPISYDYTAPEPSPTVSLERWWATTAEFKAYLLATSAIDLFL